MTTPPTGTTQVAITKQGEGHQRRVEYERQPARALGVDLQGVPGTVRGRASGGTHGVPGTQGVHLPAAGGSKSVYGQLSTGTGMMENSGTITVTRRVECGQKVKQVNTYPPGQQTSLGSMVGKGSRPARRSRPTPTSSSSSRTAPLYAWPKAPRSRRTRTARRSGTKSRSFKGTLLLGLIWAKVSAVFGDQVIELPRERSVTGRRGTTFWIVPHKKFTTLTVSKGSMWLSRTARDKLTGKVFVVKKGRLR